jgi:hypothetical protein
VETAPVRDSGEISRRERLRLAQLVICAVIFVSVVAVKLLLPGKLGAVRDSVADVMGRNMDVTEVFSAVGKAFSSRENFKKGARDVYQAVFHPEDGAVETAAKIPQGIPKSSDKMSEKHAASGVYQEKTGKTADTQQAKKKPLKSEKPLNLPVCFTRRQTARRTSAWNRPCWAFHTARRCRGCSPRPLVIGSIRLRGKNGFITASIWRRTRGTAVNCFADGTVTVSGESTSYGKYLMVAHPRRLYDAVCTLQQIAGAVWKESARR